MSSNWALVLEIAQNVCIIGLAAFLTTRVPAIKNAFTYSRYRLRDKIILLVIFGAFSAVGNWMGIPILGSMANTRIVGPIAMVAFFVGLLIFMPKIGILDWKDTEKQLPWELFVYFGGVLTLSGILMQTKSFSWLIQTVMSSLGLEALPMMPLLIILIGFSIFSHMIWSTTTAMTGVMIPIYVGLAQAMGFPIVAFCMPLAIMMAYALFLPFNTMGNIIMFGTGYYTVIEQLKTSIILGFIMWGLWIVTAFTWWKWIGLL